MFCLAAAAPVEGIRVVELLIVGQSIGHLLGEGLIRHFRQLGDAPGNLFGLGRSLDRAGCLSAAVGPGCNDRCSGACLGHQAVTGNCGHRLVRGGPCDLIRNQILRRRQGGGQLGAAPRIQGQIFLVQCHRVHIQEGAPLGLGGHLIGCRAVDLFLLALFLKGLHIEGVGRVFLQLLHRCGDLFRGLHGFELAALLLVYGISFCAFDLVPADLGGLRIRRSHLHHLGRRRLGRRVGLLRHQDSCHAHCHHQGQQPGQDPP